MVIGREPTHWHLECESTSTSRIILQGIMIILVTIIVLTRLYKSIKWYLLFDFDIKCFEFSNFVYLTSWLHSLFESIIGIEDWQIASLSIISITKFCQLSRAPVKAADIVICIIVIISRNISCTHTHTVVIHTAIIIIVQMRKSTTHHLYHQPKVFS